MADMVAAAGLELPSLTKASQVQLHEWIPPYLRVSNPVDNGGAPVRDWRGPKIIQTMLADPNVDLLLCPITGALPSMGNKLCEDLVAAAATTDKPIFVVWGSPVGTEEAYTKTLLRSSVPTFRTFTNAVMAAKAYFDHHRFAASYQSAFARPVLRPSPARRTALPVLAARQVSGAPAARACPSRTPRPSSRPTGSRCPRSAWRRRRERRPRRPRRSASPS